MIDRERSTRRMATRGGRFLLPVVLAALLLACLPARADRVVFRDFRVLEVSRAETRGDRVVLWLPGGNSLVIPASQVREIRREGQPARVEAREAREETRSTPREDWRVRAGRYARWIESAARRYRLDPELVAAVALVESSFKPTARSPRGALGIMQLMPETARELALRNPLDPRENIEGGARWLRRLLDRFGGDLELALAAYNAGEGAVMEHGGIPPYPETRSYVKKVRYALRKFRGG